MGARGEAQQDLVERLDLGDTRSDLRDDARALMAEDARERKGDAARLNGQVGVAEAGGDHLDENLARAHRVAARLRAGIVWVNGWSLLDVQMPFGGTGRSGYGRENGPEALDEYLRTKSVLINLG